MFHASTFRSWTRSAQIVAIVAGVAFGYAQSGCINDVGEPDEPTEEGSITVTETAQLEVLPTPSSIPTEWLDQPVEFEGDGTPRIWPAWVILLIVFTVGSLVWAGYSSGWDYADEASATAAAKEMCGNAVLTLCEKEFQPDPGFEWTGKVSYSYTISWRLFFTGWWYKFSCGTNYTCEVRCIGAGLAGCGGACPNPAPECCETKNSCGES